MPEVGLEKNLVDTQDVQLINSTDNKTYTQLSNVTLNIDRKVTKHQLTNDTVHNVYSLFMNYMEGDIYLTPPQITDWTILSALLTTKVWQVKYADSDGTSKTISFNAEVRTFRPSDDGDETVTHFFRLEADHVVNVS